MTPAAHLLAAYAAGTEHRGSSLRRAWAEAYDQINVYDLTESAFFEAGVMGHDVPVWVEGWRYGDIPESGLSYNHRDQHAEKGVSVMEIEGRDSGTDGTFVAFNGARPRVRVAGWLIEFTGSDGERLIVGAVPA